MKVKVELKGADEIQKEILRMAKQQRIDVRKETYATGLDIQREAKEKLKSSKAWDLGNLANSIMVDMVSGGEICEVGPEAPYGPYVEYGTKPHFPPPDALEGWAKRHGFKSAWPICKAISERGIKARPYLHPAYEKVVKRYLLRLKKMLEKAR